jgi:hypothetical protein
MVVTDFELMRLLRRQKEVLSRKPRPGLCAVSLQIPKTFLT